MKKVVSLLLTFMFAISGLYAAERLTKMEDKEDTVTSVNIAATQSAPPVITPLNEDIQPPSQEKAMPQRDGTLFDVLDGNEIRSIIELQLALQDDPAEFVQALSQTKNEFIRSEVQAIKKQFKAIPNLVKASFDYFIAMPWTLINHLLNIGKSQLSIANALRLPLIPYIFARNITFNAPKLKEIVQNISAVDLDGQSLCNIFYFMEREVKECEEQSLSLRGYSNAVLPTCIGDLTQLKELYIGNNKIRVFPRWISRLVNLEVLDLSQNELEDIPDKVGRLLNLTSLDLKVNNIQTLPIQIGTLIGLKTLRLEFNHIRLLPQFLSNLTNLSTLTLRDNECDKLEDLSNLGFRRRLIIVDDEFYASKYGAPVMTREISGYCYGCS